MQRGMRARRCLLPKRAKRTRCASTSTSDGPANVPNRSERALLQEKAEQKERIEQLQAQLAAQAETIARQNAAGGAAGEEEAVKRTIAPLLSEIEDSVTILWVRGCNCRCRCDPFSFRVPNSMLSSRAAEAARECVPQCR